MAKLRVFELAVDLKCTNRELITALEQLQIKVESHLSSLEEEQVNTIKNSNLVFEGRYLKTDAFLKRMEEASKEFRKSLPRDHRKFCQAECFGMTDVALKRMLQRFNIPKRNPDIAKKPLEGKRIEIRDGETGHTYENLFGDYLRNAKSVSGGAKMYQIGRFENASQKWE